MPPCEHKRGRCHRDEQKQPQVWESDRLQVLAYAYLLEMALGVTIAEGRVRYHADNVLVHVPLDNAGRAWVREMIDRLQDSTHRPPVTDKRLCTRCSLAPVCLPEEATFLQDSRNHQYFPLDQPSRPHTTFQSRSY
jgi:CRISP-associated protein Cas1